MRVDTERLRRMMKKRGWNQERMAEQLDLNRCTFSRKFSAGAESFSIHQMHRISETLELTPEECFSVFFQRERPRVR